MANATLFDVPPAPVYDADGYGPHRGHAFDAISAACRKKINAPAEWRWYSWEVMDRKNPENSPVSIEGAVPIGVRKDGMPKWPARKLCDRLVLYKADVDAAKLEYEQQSGKCSECVEGHYACGWSADRGTKYRPCSRCNGTGSALSVLPHDPKEER